MICNILLEFQWNFDFLLKKRVLNGNYVIIASYAEEPFCEFFLLIDFVNDGISFGFLRWIKFNFSLLGPRLKDLLLLS